MKEYKCEKCNYFTDRKSSIHKHLRSKKCINNNKKDNEIIKDTTENNKEITKNQCKFCKKLFSTKYNLNKHSKKCKKKIEFEYKEREKKLKEENAKLREQLKKKDDKIMEKDVKIMEKDIQIMEKEIFYKAELKKKDDEIKDEKEQNKKLVNTTTGLYDDNKTLRESIKINQSNKYTMFREWGKENRDFMTYEVYLDILGKETLTDMVSYMIKTIHFNSQHPENNNIFLNNYENSTVYMGNGIWKVKKLNDVLYTVINRETIHLNDFKKSNNIIFDDLEKEQNYIKDTELLTTNSDKVKKSTIKNTTSLLKTINGFHYNLLREFPEDDSKIESMENFIIKVEGVKKSLELINGIGICLVTQLNLDKTVPKKHCRVVYINKIIK